MNVMEISGTLLICFIISNCVIFCHARDNEIVTWGLQSGLSIEQTLLQYNLTVSYLSEELNKTVDLIIVQDDTEMIPLVKNGTVDFITAGPTLTACLQSETDIVPLATVLLNQSNTIISEIGGIIFTHVNNTDVFNLEDIRGKTILGGPFTYVSAFQAEWGVLEQKGIRLFAQAANVFIASSPDQVIFDIQQGKYPVGFAAASSISRLQNLGRVEAGDFRIINPLNFSTYPYTTSTPLYPNSQISTVAGFGADNSAALVRAFSRLPDEVMQTSMIVGIKNPFNVFDTFRLQNAIGVQRPPFQRCQTLDDITALVSCPSGSHRSSLSCDELHINCPTGYTCVCQPCIPNPKAIGSLTIGAFIGILLIPILILACGGFLIYRLKTFRAPPVPPNELSIFPSDVAWQERSQTSSVTNISGNFRGDHVIISGIFNEKLHTIPWRYLGFADAVVQYERLIELRAMMTNSNLAKTIGFAYLDVNPYLSQFRKQYMIIDEISGMKPKSHSREIISGDHINRRKTLIPDPGTTVLTQIFYGGQFGTLRHLILNPSCPFDISFVLHVLIGIAKGYIALHSQSPPKTGLNVRTHNILLGSSVWGIDPLLLADMTQDRIFDVWQAPEVLAGQKAYFRSDVYTFGMIMYELIHRKDPFSDEVISHDRNCGVLDQIRDIEVLDRHQRRPTIQKRYREDILYELMEQCWKADVSSRPSMTDVVKTLQQLADRHPIVQTSASRSRRASGTMGLREDEAAILFAEGNNVSDFYDLAKILRVTSVPTDQHDKSTHRFIGIAFDKDACRRLADLAYGVFANQPLNIGIHIGSVIEQDIPSPDITPVLLGCCLPTAQIISKQSISPAVLVSQSAADVLFKDKSFKGILQKFPGTVQSRGFPDLSIYKLTF